jgi:hypothetical protein
VISAFHFSEVRVFDLFSLYDNITFQGVIISHPRYDMATSKKRRRSQYWIETGLWRNTSLVNPKEILILVGA